MRDGLVCEIARAPEHGAGVRVRDYNRPRRHANCFHGGPIACVRAVNHHTGRLQPLDEGATEAGEASIGRLFASIAGENS